MIASAALRRLPALRVALRGGQERSGDGSRPAWLSLRGDGTELPILAIMLFTCLLRLPFIGAAHIHIDETYYLLFADRWAAGAMPYVDIWDRKPIGLFAIYRLALWLGGGAAGGIVAYQLLAGAAVIGTALLLAALATRWRGAAAGLAAGLLYPASLAVLQGSGGQATIFANLLVVAAATLLVRRDPAGPLQLAAPALLLGLALQIKYSVVFDAIVFGIVALARLQRAGSRWRTLAGAATVMIGCGLLPTIIVTAVFAHLGALAPFLHANFGTVAAKSAAVHRGTPRALVLLLPLASLAASRLRTDRLAAIDIALLLWLAATIAGAFVIGLTSEHYLQPALLPLVLLAAAGMGSAFGRRGLASAIGVTVVIAIIATAIQYRREGSPYASYRIAAAVSAHLQGGCLFVVDTYPLLYALSQSCTPTPYLFPTHLTRSDEIGSIGIDAPAELRRVLANAPSVIAMTLPQRPDLAPEAMQAIDAELARHYRPGDRFPFPKGEYVLFYRASR